MVQGVGVAGCGWRPQVDALSPSFRVITFDNRGIGGSTRGSAPLTIDLMADDALAIADAESLERFHLVGHSMGGLIAQAAAIRARPRILSLTLMCTFADGREGSKMSLGDDAACDPHARRHQADAAARDDEPDHAAGVRHGGE